MEPDTDVLIVGAGLAGLGFAVQLIRKYGHRNFEIVEKAHGFGGTWLVNSYPGCGVDVASHYYSYSFEPNPDWSHKFVLQPEILTYLQEVAKKYDIAEHVRFQHKVVEARWQETETSWLVTIEDLSTQQTFQRSCKIFISAVGVLSVPKRCDVPGRSEFEGRLFHTAEWDHSFDWRDKEIVVVGNGCSATQVVPCIIEGDKAAKKVTQFARQAQWIFQRPNPKYSWRFKWMMRWVPLARRLYRLAQNYYAEIDFYSFDTVKGAAIRKFMGNFAMQYMQSTAPKRYHAFLTPKTEPGCVRRVMDSDYLESLNRDNVELIYDDPIDSFVQRGIRTKSGRIIPADAVVMANGFEVQKPLAALNIYGRDGVSVISHWQEFSDGAPSAYFGACLSGFPNFFIIMGPNTASGHGNVLYVTECQINWSLRAIAPVMSSMRGRWSILSRLRRKVDVVEIKPDAERSDIEEVQQRLKGLVWASGCTSWALDPVSKRNTTMYPDFQWKFWMRSLWVRWSNFEQRSGTTPVRADASTLSKSGFGYLALAVTGIGVALHFVVGRPVL